VSLLERIMGLRNPDTVAKNMMLEQQALAEQAAETQQSEVIINLNVAVLEDGQIRIFFNWANDSKEVAALTGELLHKLNQGDYVHMFVNLLNSYVEKQIMRKQFISNIMTSWQTEYAKDEEPIEPPRDALRINSE
jgi:hypothetical protein